MNPIQIICERAIPNQHGSKYNGFAFDGCYYYLTCSALSKIIKYDLHLCEVECFTTQKPYTCICYDLCNNCFWAASSNHVNKLFKLDCALNEIDCLTVFPCERCSIVITGVSFDCKTKQLLVSFANSIVCVDPTGCQKPKPLQRLGTAHSTNVLSISPSYIATEVQNSKQTVAVYGHDSKLHCRLSVPRGYVVEAIIFMPCVHSCDHILHFYILTTKNGCYPYILEWILNGSDLEICHCNYVICRCCGSPCPKPPCPEPPCPEPPNSCNDIIESIALIEAALSHILNAEGEKLQKVIASTDDIDKILCANKAINETIVNVTHLEIILHDKLAAIKDCCPVCESEPKEPEEWFENFATRSKKFFTSLLALK
ncbi:MAG: hypothetical protein RSF86_01385 [Angelakisella sp.]